jgi:chromosome segregation ATPase
MSTAELQNIDKSINELRMAITNLELKENAQQKEIDAATAIKVEIGRVLKEKKKELKEKRNELFHLNKLHNLQNPNM